MKQPIKHGMSFSQVLASNLTIALKIAGPAGALGGPTRHTLSAMQQSTGIARSTMRKLREGNADTSNPDLTTLCRIAEELCIPVAFLLMGRQEWKTLLSAFHSALGSDFNAAADQQQSRHGLGTPQAGLRILRALGVYPLPKPAIVDERDQPELALRARQDAAFRRATLVTSALMQAAETDPASLKQLTLLAASHANADKSRYLSEM